MLTITLPPELEERLRDAASRKGVDAAEYATSLIDRGLHEPGRSLLELLEQWDEEDATTDPAELERQRKEGEEFMRNLARNRVEMEGPDARKLWP